MSGHYHPVNLIEIVLFSCFLVRDTMILWESPTLGFGDEILVPVLPLTSCVTLKKAFHFLCSNLLSCEMEEVKFHDPHNPV